MYQDGMRDTSDDTGLELGTHTRPSDRLETSDSSAGGRSSFGHTCESRTIPADLTSAGVFQRWGFPGSPAVKPWCVPGRSEVRIKMGIPGEPDCQALVSAKRSQAGRRCK